MKKVSVEIYSDASNMTVLRHPDRDHPGSLIQGDSLNILIQDIKEARNEIDKGDTEEAKDILDAIIESLEDRLEHYKKALKDHDMEFPFVE